MSQLTLWKMAASPPSWAVLMLADILDLNMECKDVDGLHLEHKSPEFKKINPMGTVPVIKDGDFIVSESHAIMKYLLSKHGAEHQESLYPSEIRARALVDQALFCDTGVVFIALKRVALPTLLQGLQGLNAELEEQIEDAYSIVEEYLNRSRYVAGDHLTLADLSLGSSVAALDGVLKIDVIRFPRSVAWLGMLAGEPFFKNIAVPGAARLSYILNLFWEKRKKTNQI